MDKVKDTNDDDKDTDDDDKVGARAGSVHLVDDKDTDDDDMDTDDYDKDTVLMMIRILKIMIRILY